MDEEEKDDRRGWLGEVDGRGEVTGRGVKSKSDWKLEKEEGGGWLRVEKVWRRNWRCGRR